MPEQSENELDHFRQEHVRLFRTINHDVKSPLYAIQSLTRMFAENPESFSEDELKTMAVEINRSVGSIGEILESLLGWMDYQKIRYNLALTHENLQEELQLAMDEIMPRARQKDIEIQAELSAVNVRCIESGLRRAAIILLNNAVKFSPDGSRITIASRGPDDRNRIRLTVRDQGPGLSEKARNQLFKIEERIISEGTRGEKGAGLGLLMAGDIMERSGGQAGIEESEAGACFYLEMQAAGDA